MPPVISHAADGVPAPQEDPLTPGLWPGDTGELAEVSRRALVQLLRGPYVSARINPNLWSAVLADRDMIRSRLADLFLELVVDLDLELAFIRNVAGPGLDAPTVVRTANLTFLQTAMVLHLRQLLLREGEGGRVFVSRVELTEQLDVYRTQRGDDEATFAKRVSSAWTAMRDHGFLSRPNAEGHSEISPVLRLVLGPEEVEEVTRELRRIVDGGGGAQGDGGGGGDGDGGGAGSADEDGDSGDSDDGDDSDDGRGDAIVYRLHREVDRGSGDRERDR
jgi:hypothetical protein